MPLPPPRRITRLIALAIGIPFLVGLAVLTLSPVPVEDAAPDLLDTVLGALHDDLGWTWAGFDTLEVLANILVFVPVGALAFLLLPRRLWPLSFAVGPVLSLLIEAVQSAALPGRTASLIDVLANSAGATFGAAGALLIASAFALRRAPGVPSPSLETP